MKNINLQWKIEYYSYNNLSFKNIYFAKNEEDAIRVANGLKKLKHITEVTINQYY